MFNVRAFTSWQKKERTVIEGCPTYHDLPADLPERARRARAPASFSTSGSETPKKKRFIVNSESDDETSEEDSGVTPCDDSDTNESYYPGHPII